MLGEDQELNLRDSEREPAVTVPLAVRPRVARVEPATAIVVVHAEHARSAVKALDGFVHDSYPPEAHYPKLLISELLADQASDFGIRLPELALFGLGANIIRDPVVVLEEPALENGDFSRHAGGRLEVRRTEYAICVVSHAETLALQARDPVLTGRAVALHREVDDTVFLAP